MLILTPVKDAADCLDDYFRLSSPTDVPASLDLARLPRERQLRHDLPRPPAPRTREPRSEFRRVEVWKKDFGYRIPPGVPRWAPEIQVERRRVWRKSRNHLLFRALDDEAWVLWLDVDVVEYPPDLIERLLGTGKDIVQPHCVLDYGGPTFDLNGWRDHGRLHLDDLRGEGELVELDAVGGTVLLVRADVHREGLVYPPFLYGAANPRVRTGRAQYVRGQHCGRDRDGRPRHHGARHGLSLLGDATLRGHPPTESDRPARRGGAAPMNTPRPRLLYLSPVVPATTGNGLAMRAGMVLRLLASQYRVSLLVVRLYPPFQGPIPAAIADVCDEAVTIPAEPCEPTGGVVAFTACGACSAASRWATLTAPTAG